MERAALIWLVVPIAVFAVGALAAEEGEGLSAARDALKIMVPCIVKDNKLALDHQVWNDAQVKRKAERKARKKNDDDDGEMDPAKAARARFDKMESDRLEKGPIMGKLFNDVMNKIGGANGGMGSGQSGNTYDWHSDRQNITGRLVFDATLNTIELNFQEKTGAKRLLNVIDDPQFGLTIRYAEAESERGFIFVQTRNGSASLIGFQASGNVALTAENFSRLVVKDPQSLDHFFFQPLENVGIELLYRYHPRVLAAATAAAAPARQLAVQIEALVKALASEQMDERDRASLELSKLYPQAGQFIAKLGRESGDGEVEQRTEKIVQADRGATARAEKFVTDSKLRDDRAYLLEIMEKYPAYKEAAHARLAVLYGKDYGETVAAWPKP